MIFQALGRCKRLKDNPFETQEEKWWCAAAANSNRFRVN